MPQRTVAAWVYGRRTARQYKGIQFLQLARQLFRRQFERDLKRFSASFSYSLEIEIKLVARAVALFLGGSPRDTHTGAIGGARLGLNRGHGTPNRSIRQKRRQPVGVEI